MHLKTWLCLLSLCVTSAHSQTQAPAPIHISLEARGDYQRDYIDGKNIKDNTGFKGQVVNFIAKGDLGTRFSYMYRQRLNGINRDHSFFDATDWLYLTYHISPQWSLSAGKWAVLTGGWEFDPAPIDVFQVYEFAYHFPCYEWGAWATWNSRDRHHTLIFQLVESPFQRGYNKTAEAEGRDKGEMYAYNLVWYGNIGPVHPLCSVNLTEYAPGRYINYICLGSRFDVSSKVKVQADLMNRAASHQAFLLRDCSLSGMVEYYPCPKVKAWAKASYDVNRASNHADTALGEGTEITRVGAGVEYRPLADKRVRLHANYSYAFGRNTTPDAFLHDGQQTVNVGVTWRMKVL